MDKVMKLDAYRLNYFIHQTFQSKTILEIHWSLLVSNLFLSLFSFVVCIILHTVHWCLLPCIPEYTQKSLFDSELDKFHQCQDEDVVFSTQPESIFSPTHSNQFQISNVIYLQYRVLYGQLQGNLRPSPIH